MMNLFALGLVVISLTVAGVWSPAPERQSNGDDVIVKEGHRVIVVEYDKDGGENTRVSISPEHDHHRVSTMGKLSEVGHGFSGETDGHGGRELICDALGKCTHRIAATIGKAKEKVEEGVMEAKEVAGEVLDKTRERVSHAAHEVGEGAKAAVEKVKHTGKTAVDMSDTVRGDVARNVTENAENVKSTGKSAVEKAKEAKETVEQTMDKVKTSASKVKEEGTKELEEMVGRGQELAKETVGHTADKVKTEAAKVKEEGKKEVGEMVGRGRELANYVIEVMGLPETWNSLMGVVNLLGFATAYGMSVWVTFVSSYVLAGALPRQQFGIVQSKIYPVYFRSMAYGIGMALLGHLLSQRKKLFSSKEDMFQCYNLLASLLIVLANLMYLEPRATKVMFERMKMEKEEGRGRDIGEPSKQSVPEHPATTTTTTRTTATVAEPEPQQERPEQRELNRARIRRLSERLKKLNSYSSFLNIFTLMSLTWHLVYLGQRLHVTC